MSITTTIVSIEITDSSDLESSNDLIPITITFADGTKKTYRVTLAQLRGLESKTNLTALGVRPVVGYTLSTRAAFAAMNGGMSRY